MGTDSADIEVDVVVVGAGGAGMTAAAEAAAAGLKVVIIEKAQVVGGTTRLSVGSIMAAGGDFQRRAGIADSPAEHDQDLARISGALGAHDDPDLRKLLTDNVADTVRFLQSIGVNFLGPLPQPPHEKSRLHQVMPTSRAYVHRLEKLCRRRGVEIRVGTRLTALIVTEGRVTGVVAERDGRPVRLRATRGVVLASGDMGANNALMHAHMKSWAKGIEPYNPHSTGDGQVAAAAIGGQIVSRKELGPEMAAAIRFVRPGPSWLHRVPPYPWLTRAMILAQKLLPAALIRPFTMKFLTTALGPDRGVYEQGAILVNRKGERFVDELRAPAIHLTEQPEGEAYIVFDGRFGRKFSAWPYFISTAPGVAFAYLRDYRAARPDLYNEARSIAELAARLGMPADALAATIAATNAGREEALRLVEPPYYALGPVKTWVLVGSIGLAVNTRLEVLDADRRAIPGLYAVGQAGVGAMFLSGHGHGLGWAFTSGRLVARSLAAAAPSAQGPD
ncbi:MAG TPA: FAD-dependent oxidoreductase [Allosphingosinicella sp.]|nr:FAD-dependent oxidoreductase [Allosphingosinicella sp.]